jgi:(p)ppGpp synthase/HD superfamily hydrolase
MNLSRILLAASFAARAHDKQERDIGEGVKVPYVTHTLEVAAAVAAAVGDEQERHGYHCGLVGEDMIIAAILHDTVEDTKVTLEDILREFGPDVAGLVDELTDKFVPAPGTNRAERKRKERERLMRCSPAAMLIKRCDVEHNRRFITAVDPKFAKVYEVETETLLNALQVHT